MRLSELRIARGMTQKQLAEHLGVTIRTITNYENGSREPNIGILIELADIFSIPIDYLVGRTDDTAPEVDTASSRISVKDDNEGKVVVECDLNGNQMKMKFKKGTSAQAISAILAPMLVTFADLKNEPAPENTDSGVADAIKETA